VSVAQETSCAPQERRIPEGRTFRAWVSPIVAQLRTTLAYFARPIHLIRAYDHHSLRADVVAALTVAIVMLPQAIAFALIAELPPSAGLYSAIVASVVGGLWGSSSHLQTGPTNTTSLLVLSVLLTIARPDQPEYLVIAGVMAVLVGVFRLAMGLARLGVLVNFVSRAVIVGFTAGAGILIFANQLRHLLRLDIPSAPRLNQTIVDLATHITETHWISLIIGVGTIALVSMLRRVNPKLPGPLVAMVTAAIVVGVFRLEAQDVRVVGELPRGFPPLAELPLTDWALIGDLATGSLAVAAIGLVESISIARVISTQTGERLDSNQEFIGQGLASIASGLFSGYPCSGSFTRSAVNFQAGAKTGFAGVLAGIFVLVAMIVLAPLARYVPLSSLAGVLILTALGLIERKEIARIWNSEHGDRVIMIVTLVATLAIPLRYAVLSGIGLSLLYYLVRTSTPRVRAVLPDASFRHFAYQPQKPACTQLGVIEILGDLYFGATNHVEDCIQRNLEQNPDQLYLLLRMHGVEECDISGIHALESIVRNYRERGGDVYLVRVRERALELMQNSGFYDYLGADHFLGPDGAIAHLFYQVIDPAICIYECPVRAFQECQNLPKQRYPEAIRLGVESAPDDVPAIAAQDLWAELHSDTPPHVIDVREPREYRQGRIPDAESMPLPIMLNHTDQIPRDRPVVLVCRGGRRSMRATALLREHGYDNVQVLRGGMIAWENAQLLEAVDRYGEGEYEPSPVS
jgi:SulP family sulfate permease